MLRDEVLFTITGAKHVKGQPEVRCSAYSLERAESIKEQMKKFGFRSVKVTKCTIGSLV